MSTHDKPVRLAYQSTRKLTVSGFPLLHWWHREMKRRCISSVTSVNTFISLRRFITWKTTIPTISISQFNYVGKKQVTFDCQVFIISWPSTKLTFFQHLQLMRKSLLLLVVCRFFGGGDGHKQINIVRCSIRRVRVHSFLSLGRFLI